MEQLAEKEIRASFVNCSKGEAGRINLPRSLPETPWDELDFLGWRDPGAPDRSYLVTGYQGVLTGITLRVPTGIRRSLTRTNICSFCATSHAGSGVALLTARKSGPAGRQGNSVGAYVCADLACSLYVRGRKKSQLIERYVENLTVEEQVERLVANVGLFLDRVHLQGEGEGY